MQADINTPAGRSIIDRLASAILQVCKKSELTNYRTGLGGESASSTPEELAIFLETEHTKWGRLFNIQISNLNDVVIVKV